MRTSGIGTRYAFYVAALSLALVALTLAAAGGIALGRMRVLQQELREAVTTARAADDERALDGAARYLGLHLFNPLYQLDVERLNDAIQQTQAWLPVVSFLVVDRDGLVLTDGTATNAMYGERAPGPLPAEDVPDPMLIRRDNVTELRFRVAAGGVSAGWGIVTLKEPPWEASLRRLEEERTAELWQGHRASLVSLGALVLLATVGVGVLVSLLLSRTLARPLTQMSRAAAQIAAGNLDHPLTLDSPDELGDLARALNRMAGELRAHEEALRAERSDLAAKNAELERFNYTVSHDLKTPLVTIRGFAGLAGGDLAAGRQDAVRKDLGRIVAAADKMHRLLDDLLELSRIGRVVHPPEDVPLGGLVRDGARAPEGQLEPAGHRGRGRARPARRCAPTGAGCSKCCRTCSRTPPSSRAARSGRGSSSRCARTAASASSSCATTGAASSRVSSSACSGCSRSSTRAGKARAWGSRWCAASSRRTGDGCGPSPRASAAARRSASRCPAGARGPLRPPKSRSRATPGCPFQRSPHSPSTRSSRFRRADAVQRRPVATIRSSSTRR
jgi:HAMP domain-containing protein